MSEEEKRAYAKKLIITHAKDVEFLSIFEMYDDDDEISEDDAKDVLDLIHSANVQVSW